MHLPSLTRIATFLVLAASLSTSPAQSPSTPQSTTIPARTDTMVVLGSAAPVPLAESPRSVVVLPLKGLKLAAETPLDFLRQDSSIFLEQRGAGGAQSDIVLRGGSFEQTLVLVNGFRINDSQTSHHNLDLPVPLEAMDSIQILEGAGSTLHGVDALSGVVDFLTAAPEHSSVVVRAAQGSFQSNEESLLAGTTRGRWSGRLAASRNFSEGFTADPGYTVNPGDSVTCYLPQVYRQGCDDRDYRNEDASAENWLGSRLGITDLMLATSDRSFGANRFRALQLMGAHQKLVHFHTPGTRHAHRRCLRLPPPHRRIHPSAQQPLRLREQPHRRLLASLPAPHHPHRKPIARPHRP